MVVVGDVGAVRLAGLFECLEFLAPDAALLELAEPGLDERLALGIAVAAAAMRDPRPTRTALNARAVNAEPLSVPSVRVPGVMARSAAARSISVIASVARQRVSRCQATISRVQQSIAAIS